jgi:hypothetical protein
MFLPSRLTMSAFLRPHMEMRPHSSILARSPVLNHSPSKAYLVAASFFQYPFMVMGPFT